MVNLTGYYLLCHLINQNYYCNAEALKIIDGLKTVAMTTNGIVLARKLPALKQAGLDQLNISLDTLISAKFEFITRRKGWDKVMQGIEAALEYGYSPKVIICN